MRNRFLATLIVTVGVAFSAVSTASAASNLSSTVSGPASVSAGGTATYQVSITNNAIGPIAFGQLVANVPNGMTFVSGSSVSDLGTATCTAQNGIVSCPVTAFHNTHTALIRLNFTANNQCGLNSSFQASFSGRRGQQGGGNYVTPVSITTNMVNTATPACPHPPTCTSPLSYQQVLDFWHSGLIKVDQNVLTGTYTVTNDTGCSFPIIAAAYKMQNPLPDITTQIFYDASDKVTVWGHKSATVKADLPPCNYQVDLFYGDAPQSLKNGVPNIILGSVSTAANYCVQQTQANATCQIIAPDVLQPGQQFQAMFNVQNTGTEKWIAGGGVYDAHAYKLGSRDPDNNVVFNGSRVPLPHDVAPNESVQLQWPFRAPSTPGTYSFDWSMGHEGVAWIGQKCTKQITVAAPQLTDNALCQQTEGPYNIAIGDPLTARITWKNTGDTTWTAGTGFRIEQASFSGVTPMPGMSVTMTLPNDVKPGDTVTVNYPFTNTSNLVAGQYIVATKITKNGTQIGSNVCGTTVNVKANTTDLSVIKTGPSAVRAGDTAIYTLVVTNNGSVTVPAFTVTDAIPANLTFSNYGSDIVNCSQQGSNVICTGSNLGAGQSRTFMVAFKTKDVANDGDSFCTSTIQNTATVSVTGMQDTNSSNNVSSVQTPVNCPQSTTSLSVSKSGPSSIPLSGNVSYNIVVTNGGSVTAKNVQLVDLFPYGLQYVPQSSDALCTVTAGQVTCGGFDLAAGQSKNLTLTFSVPTIVGCNTILSNSASAQATNASYVMSQQVKTNVECQTPNISVIKTALQTSGSQGDHVSYRIEVTNNGQGTADSVVLNDTIPNGLLYQSSDSSCYLNGTTISCPLGSLSSGQARSVVLNFNIAGDAQCDIVITNQASVTFAGNPSSVLSNNAFTNVVCSPAQLEIVKSTPQSIISPTGLIYYAIRIDNKGQTAAQNVVVADTIPDGAIFQSSDSGCTSNGTTVTCYLNTLPAHQSQMVNMIFQAKNTAACEQIITNTATVAATGIASITSNSAQTTVKCNPPSLRITKTPQQTEVSINGTISYAIQVTNAGESTAANVVVTDEVPAGLTFQSSDSGCVLNNTNVVCTLDALQMSQTRTVNLVFRVDPSAPCDGNILNKAHVRADGLDEVTSFPATVAVRCSAPVLQVEKTASKPNINQNESVTYQIRVINHSQSAAQNVIVRDQVPTGLTYQSSDSNCSQQSGDVVCTVGTLNSVETRTLNLTFVPSANVQCNVPIQNTARAEAIGVASVLSQPATVTVNCQSAQITVTKEASKLTANRGEEVGYRIAFTNAIGRGSATNVVLTDTVPQGMTFVGTRNGASCHLSGTQVLCDQFGDIVSGGGAEVFLTFKVTDTAQCNSAITNTATVRANNTDFTSNPSQVTVTCQPSKLTIIKTTADLNVSRGGYITYNLTARNDGQSTAQAVVITDEVPAGTQFVDASQNCHLAGDVVTCTLNDIAAGQSQTVSFRILVPQTMACASQIKNVAQVRAGGDTPVQSNEVQSVVSCSAAQLSITKSTAQTTINRNGTLNFGIVVTNNGQTAATNVVITDQIPSGLGFLNSSDPNCSSSSSTVTCTVPSLAAGQTKTINLAFHVNDTAACNASVVNYASVSADNINQIQSNPAQSTVQCNPAILSITKSTPQSTVAAGGTLFYSIEVSNNGQASAQNVVVTDQVPAGLTFVSQSSDGRCSMQGSTLTCNVTSIDAGQKATLALNFQVSSQAQCNATIYNTAMATAAGMAPVGSNQTQTTVQCNPGNLTISKSVQQSSASRGGTVNYTIVVTNNGQSPVQNVLVTDQIPNGLNYQSNDSGCTSYAGTLTCNLGTINAGQTRTINVSFTVDANAQCNTSIVNTASVQATGINSIASNQVQTNVQCQPGQLSITKSVQQSTVSQNGTINYSIVVTNSGQSAVQNVVVSDQIPSGLSFQTSDSGCTTYGGTVTCNIGALNPNQSRTVNLTFTASSVQCNATVTNTAAAQAAGINTVNSNTVQTTVQCLPGQLTINKSGSTTVTQNGTINYTIVVANSGQSAVQNVVVSDQIPSGLTFQSSDSGCQVNGGAVTCNLGTLNVGQNRTIALVFTASNVQCNATVSNTATVQGTGINTVSSNTFQTSVQCVQNPTFSISKTDNQTTAQPNDVLNYQITVTNTSNVAASNVTVSDTLPSQLSYQNASDNPSVNGNSLTWTIGSLGANASKTLTVQARIASNAANGTQIINTATVANQQATDTTTVNVVNQTGCVNISKEVYDANNNRISTVPQFSFRLDNNQTATNDANGNAQFTNVPVGSHTVTETSQSGWTQFNVTPDNGTVNVSAGGSCASVIFKNRQVVTGGGLSITKTDNRTTVTPSDTLNYQITLTNSSSAAMNNVTVTDVLPSQYLTYVSSSNNGTINGQTVTWNNLTINANSSLTLSLQARVSDSQSNNNAVITNTAQISNGPSATDTTTIQTTSGNNNQCSVSVTHYPSNPIGNDMLTYQLRVMNLSNASNQITVTQILPSRTRFNFADNGGSLAGNGVVTWNNLLFAANETKFFSVQARLDSDVTADDILLSTVTACNTSVNDTVQLNSDGTTPDIGLDITDKPDPVSPGDILTYKLRVSNRSSRPVNGLTLRATLDDNTDFDDASDNGDEASTGRVEWRNISIDADSDQTFTLKVKVNKDEQDGDTLRLRATVDNATATEDTDVVAGESSSSSEQFTGNLTFSKQADRYEAQPGDRIVYTITIRNSTSDSISDIQLNDAFDPSKVTMQDVDGGSVGGGTINWDLGVLAPGESRIIRYTGTLSPQLHHGDSVTNTATMTSDHGTLGGSATVRIIEHLPQTGAGDGTSPLEDTSAFLTPFHSATNGNALPMTLWTVMLSGIGFAGYFGKRFFI